eukprot:736406_1
MDEEDGMYGDVGDFGRGSGKKWQCGACTFKNHEWNDRCEICSALQQPAEHEGGDVDHHNPVVLLQQQYEAIGAGGWTCRVCALLDQGTNARCKVLELGSV